LYFVYLAAKHKKRQEKSKMKFLPAPLYEKLRPYGLRLVLSSRVTAGRVREPFFDFPALLRYVRHGRPYVTTRIVDFTDKLTIETGEKFKYVIFGGEAYAFPPDRDDGLCLAGFNAVLNEQLCPDSPHRYVTADQVGRDWVIYDLGAAEGYQAKQWSKTAKQVIIFEPFEFWHKLLEVTFKKEIAAGRVRVINVGISDREKTIEYRGDKIELKSLDTVVEEYALPLPDYIKVDIEGEEKNFIAGAKKVLAGGGTKKIEICVYHKPRDYVDIPTLLEEFGGEGRFSDGVILFNRDGTDWGSHKILYHPVLRKCLYKYEMPA
jgi:FkbM family methyltransferase